MTDGQRLGLSRVYMLLAVLGFAMTLSWAAVGDWAHALFVFAAGLFSYVASARLRRC